MFAVIGQKIAAQLQATSSFVTANGGNNRVFPVRIPQTQKYPCTTYEIMDVDNFVSKNQSLESCNVSIRLATFGKSYTETYSQAKAAVLALDLFSVTYSDGSSYTAKFNFETLSDEYHNNAEVFYKNIIFNCLIIKN